jgi:gas vesicle protein
MSGNQISPTTVVLGALIGGVLGGIAASMLSSKHEGSLKENCQDYCQEYSEKIKSFMQEVGDSINDKTSCMTEKAKDVYESVSDKIGQFPSLDNKDFKAGLIVGSVVGGVLGVGAVSMFQGINTSNKCSQSTNWQKIGKELLDACGNTKQAEAGCKSKTMHDVLDFAVAGMQLWHSMKKR